MVEITPSRTKLPAHVVVITPYVVDFPPTSYSSQENHWRKRQIGPQKQLNKVQLVNFNVIISLVYL